MITIGMNYSVRPGKEEVFESAFKSVLEVMESAEGHADSVLYRSVGENSRNYLIVSHWTEESAFKEFIASDRFKKVTNWGRENILEGRPSHTTYRESDAT